MIDDREWARLAKYLAGELSEEEAAVVRAWIAADHEREQLLAALISAWKAASEPPVTWDAARGWARLRAKASARDSIEPPVSATDSLRRRQAIGMGLASGPSAARSWSGTAWPRAVAAGLVLATSAGIWTLVQRVRSTGSLRGPSFSRVYVTARGERATVTLADGTQLTLAPASRLRVAADYGRARRDVWLEGEAFAAVRHDGGHPFAIHAGNALVEDIGTRFDVRTYGAEKDVRVVVTEGAVALRGRDGRDATGTSSTRLTAGMAGAVNAGGVAGVLSGVDADRSIAWTKGELVFTGAPLRDVLDELSRWFDVDVQLGNPVLAERPVLLSVRDVSADDALTALATTFGVTWRRDGHTMVFAPVTGRP